MSLPAYVNGKDIYERYKAKLLDYRVGPHSISNSFLSQANSIIPVKLSYSVRNMTSFQISTNSISSSSLPATKDIIHN